MIRNLKDCKRFWTKVIAASPDECWTWTGSKADHRYGALWDVPEKKMHLAHIVSYSAYVGEIPDGLKVLHTCDNPACVNPAHLWLGTMLDNSRDRDRKGRNGGWKTRGSNHGRAKLTEHDVPVIREMYASGAHSLEGIAEKFGVNHRTIAAVINGLTWRHV